MNELLNPRVPGLGLAPTPDVDRYFPREDAALVREYGHDVSLAAFRRRRNGAGLHDVLARIVTAYRGRPHRAKTHRAAGPLVPLARA